ncbi:phosphopantetheine-binding protein [Micromonospora sp. WMMD1102]|uniref:acyl carrier protein n=1 Tax=Micromonospora sp. WMMD1102 TaxID=3016105 RepID=UPI002414FC35|nr:phosphopantetheine-binding protein [Micromonospora sp. WMMD1102]MDG4785110.1 phosphopantetheine-binding protein [Micromonospora sp. WMMD1102]
MERAQAVEHIRVSLEAVLNQHLPEVDERTRLFEDLAIDSMSVLELLIGLEDSIDLEIDPTELNADVFQTVGTLTDYVCGQLAKAPA